MKIMRVFDVDKVSYETIDKLFDFWKNFNRINESIPKNLKGLFLICLWVKSCLELKIKNSTVEGLEKEFKRKQEKLEEITAQTQENASKILRLTEEKEFLKANLEKLNEKSLKELEKFVRNKEKIESQKLEQKSQKNLKILLKEMKSSEERKNGENIVKEDSSIINVSEELFNIAYKSPHSQDLRQKFLINCPRNIQLTKKETSSWRGNVFGLNDKIFKKPKTKSNVESELKKPLEQQKIKLNLGKIEKEEEEQKKSGFLTERTQNKYNSALKKDDRKNSLTILRKPKEEMEIDEYELNLRENEKEGNFKGFSYQNANANQPFCNSNCCKAKWC